MYANSTAAADAAGLPSRQGPLIGLQVLLISIAFIMCSLRIYSRLLVVRRLGFDDYLMVVSTVVSLLLSINSCVGTKFGWGRHIYDVPIENIPGVLLVGWLSQILFTLSTSLVKLSILNFYLRLATVGTYRRVIQGTIAFVTIYAITFIILIIFQCTPVSAYWIPSNGELNPKCFKADYALLVHGIVNVLSDLFIYVLPMPMLWRTQLPKKQRLGLIALFGVGFITCIAGALRLYYSIAVVDSQDGTWYGFELWTWEAVEVNLAIACACVPALKPLLIRWFPMMISSLFGQTTNTARRGASNGNGSFIPMGSQHAKPAGSARKDVPTPGFGKWAGDDVMVQTTIKAFPRRKECDSEESLTGVH